MGLLNINNGVSQEKGITYTVIIDDISNDFGDVSNNTYFLDKQTQLVYYKNSTGDLVSIYEQGGSDITNSAGAVLTYNTTTGKIDLGGKFNRGTGDGDNRLYFSPSSGSNSVNWGIALDRTTGLRTLAADDPSDMANHHYISWFDYYSSLGYKNIIGLYGLKASDPSASPLKGCLEAQGSTSYSKRYRDITHVANSSGVIQGFSAGDATDTLLTFHESDDVDSAQRQIWQSAGSNTTSFKKQTFDQFEWNVYNDAGHNARQRLGSFYTDIIVPSADNSTNAFFLMMPSSLYWKDGQGKGFTTVPDGTWIGGISTTAGTESRLAIGLGTTDTYFFTGSNSNNRGIKYIGFGETDTETGVDADYTTLVGTSLVPKKYVDDVISGIYTIYSADGTLSGNRIVDLNGKTLGITQTGNFDGLKIDYTSSGLSNYQKNSFQVLSEADNGNFQITGKQGGVLIEGNNSFTKKDQSGNIDFQIDSNGGGYWKGSTNITIGEDAYGKIVFPSGQGGFLNFYNGSDISHVISRGAVNQDVAFFRQGLGTNKTFIVGGTAEIGTERISLQGDTLISKKLELSTTTDGFLMPRLTTAQMDAILDPDTDLLVFNTDLDCVMRYDGTTWTTFDTPKYILKTAGACTPYSDLYTAINDAVNGSIIDVNISETVDCGGINTWTWSSDITINFNGHHTIFNNLGRILLAAGVSLGINNGTLESSAIVSSNTAAIMFSGGNTVKGDGAITVFQNNGVSTRGSFQSQTGTTPNYISGVIMKGSYTFCVKNDISKGRIYIDNCILYTDLSTNVDALYGDNMEISNSTIHGRAFSLSGSYTIPSRETVRVFNNCTIISDGETSIGSRSVIFNSCTITTNDNEVRIGIGGEQEYYNCKLERTGTVGTAFNITNTSNVKMYNTQIISTGGGVITNLPMEFYNCYIKANSGSGITHTSSINDLNLIVENTYIEVTGGNCMYFDRINEGLTATVTNSTLICNTVNNFCLNARSGSYYKFLNNTFKNTADSNDIYNRVDIYSENPQIETTDAFGNIILK